MSCIQFHSPLTLLHSQPKHNQQPNLYNPFLRTPTLSQTKLAKCSRRLPSRAPVMASGATYNLVVLDVAFGAGRGDLSVMLQTSALLLFVYFMANFVTPYFISKSFQASEESVPDESIDSSSDDD